MKMIDENWVWKTQRNPVTLFYDCRVNFSAISSFNICKKVKIDSEYIVTLLDLLVRYLYQRSNAMYNDSTTPAAGSTTWKVEENLLPEQ